LLLLWCCNVRLFDWFDFFASFFRSSFF
jgi:hypothetical protein